MFFRSVLIAFIFLLSFNSNATILPEIPTSCTKTVVKNNEDVEILTPEFKTISQEILNFVTCEIQPEECRRTINEDLQVAIGKELELYKKTLQENKITIGNYNFTKRKLEILEALYIHSDKKEKEIAHILNISESALKTHKKGLFDISNTKNTPELIKFGIQNGLILP